MRKLSVGFIFLTVINFAFLQIRCSAQEGSLSRVKVTKYSGPSDPSPSLPIKPTRTISFTTDEGTNMNVDISPDGRTLLFDLLGDLYTLPVTGGTATQITRGMAINLRPVWSPDGKSIAYISDYSGALHLNIRNVAGNFHLILGKSDNQIRYFNNPCPLWGFEGKYVYIDGNVYDLLGDKIAPPAAEKTPIRFSANGNTLFYLDSRRLYSYDKMKNRRIAISPVLEPFQSSAISPDGQWWVYITDSSGKKCLIAQDLVNMKSKILVSSLFIRYPFFKIDRLALHFSFSPDSKSLFIGYGGKIHRLQLENGTDEIIPFKAHINVDAGPLDYNTFRISEDSMKVNYTRSANASPDGKHLVFSALNKIYVMDLPLGKPHLLVNQPYCQFQPKFSPDGKWVAYVSWCDTVGGYLWRVPIAGGEPEKLSTCAGQYQRPAWSPDGSKIAVIERVSEFRNENYPDYGKLELIPVNGGGIRIIDDTVPMWNNITFSEDGSSIFYEPTTMPFTGRIGALLMSKNIITDSSNVLAIGRARDNTYFIQQRSISPDGRYIVFSMGEDLYLLPVCKMLFPAVIYDDREKLSLIRFTAGVDPYWEKGGKTLSWSYGNRFFRIDPDKIVAAAQKRTAAELSASNFITVKIRPDQVVNMNIVVPKRHLHGVITLRGARVITMDGNVVFKNGTIVIKNGRIITVGPTDRVRIPTKSYLLDLRGKTVMPGLIDLHLHMHLLPDIFPQQSWVALINLAYGVTTARDPSINIDSYGYKELLESGQMIGPRLFPAGRPVLLDDGGINRIDNFTDAVAIVQKRVTLGGTFVKQYLLPTRLQMQWLLLASRQAKANMTNEGPFDPLFTIAMMKDGSTGVEHNPEWGDIYGDVITLISKMGSYLTPTLQVRYGDGLYRSNSNLLYWTPPNSKLVRFAPQEVLKKILKTKYVDTINSGFIYPASIDARIRTQGGFVTVGSHGNDEGIGVHNEIWAMQMGGLTNMEALQAATILGAKGLGIQKDVGSIQVGKIADLLILDRNPLEDIHNTREIHYVMKEGVLYDGSTLDILWPAQNKMPGVETQTIDRSLISV